MVSRLITLFLFTTLTCALAQEVINAESSEQPRCDDKETSEICSACARLSPSLRVPSGKCCSDRQTLMFCDACIADIDSCNKFVKELDDLAEFEAEQEYYDDEDDSSEEEEGAADDYEDELFADADVVDSERTKRFGRLFMKTPKRYGRIFFGKRSSDLTDSDIEKRFGRLYMGSGSYFGKRSENDVEKRYGSLFMNKNRNRWFGKRSGEPDLEADVDVAKRYGPLFMGSSRKGWYGKRSDVTKRYGPLFIGSSRKGWFGKRSDEDSEDSDVSKRYGALNLGNGGYFGKRSEPIVADKRFGRLFMGRRRGSWLG